MTANYEYAESTKVEFLQKTLTVPTGPSTVTLVWFGALRAGSSGTEVFEIESVTLGGVAMTEVETQYAAATNRYFMQALYMMVDPYVETGTATPLLRIDSSRLVASFVAYAVHTESASEVISSNLNVFNSTGVSIDVDFTTEGGASQVYSFAWLANNQVFAGWNDETLSEDGDDTQQVHSSYTGRDDLGRDMVFTFGNIANFGVNTYNIGYSWGGSSKHMMTVVEVAAAPPASDFSMSLTDPTLIFGEYTSDAITSDLSLESVAGVTGVASQPPVQVVGLGNLFFVSKSQTVNCILLATAGSSWTIATTGETNEQLGLRVSRHKGYLIPR